MNKQTAEKMFNLTGEYTLSDLTARFRDFARANHPDSVGNADKESATERMTQANLARSVLVRLFTGKNLDYKVHAGNDPIQEEDPLKAATVNTQAAGTGNSSADAPKPQQPGSPQPQRPTSETNYQHTGEEDFREHGFVYSIFRHFPYRLTLLVFAMLAFMNASGMDMSNMGLAFGAPAAEAGDFMTFVGLTLLVLASMFNVLTGLITKPLRWLILRIISGVESAWHILRMDK